MSSIINSKPVEVAYRDGTKETVELRDLSIRQLYLFIEHFGQSNTPALVVLAVGKELDWVDTLADASFGELAKQVIKINFPRAEAMISQDITVAARLAPTLHRLVLAEAMFAGTPSKDKSPEPAASGSAVATGNGSSTLARRDSVPC